MKLKAIVATATSETEANLIFAEIAKTHAFIEFFKINGCQVTVVYEPDQSRFDRINREAEEEKAALPPIKKSVKKLTIEDLEAKIKQLGLDKDLLVTVTAWRLDKPQEYTVYDINWNLLKPAIFKSKSAIAVSRKLSKIHKERQAVQVGHNLAVDTSEPIDIQKVCPHCDRLLEKDQVCCLSCGSQAYQHLSKTIVTQTGLIKTVDNGSFVDYQIGKFSYLCDHNSLIVTKQSGTGIINIASYTYKSEDEAQDAGWRMARRQETVEKEVLKQQTAAAKVTATTAKQRQGQSKQVKVKSSS